MFLSRAPVILFFSSNRDKSTMFAPNALPDNGELFNLAGSSSLGSLPRGPVIPRIDPIYITSTHAPATYFAIGAMPKTAPIPDAVLVRGNKELRDRNVARAAGVASREFTDNLAPVTALVSETDTIAPTNSLAANNASVARAIASAEARMDNLAVAQAERLQERGETNPNFLGHDLVTRTDRIM